MPRKLFETEITDDGASLAGPWRAPKQMLAEQVYDDHASIHDDATAQRLGFRGGTIEGPTHFSQFAPLGERIWGRAWFESGCLSAHYRNPVFAGEEVRAMMAMPAPGALQTEIRMVKRDGAEVLRGTASVAGAHGPTALEHGSPAGCRRSTIR
jgi:acyl dehydratase